MAGVTPGHVCSAVAPLRRLDAAGMGVVLAALPPSVRSQCVRSAGLRLRVDAPADRVAKLLVARLRSIGGVEAHNVVVAITDPARAQLLEIVGEDEERLVDDVARGLAGPLSGWSTPVLGALFALLGELGAYPATTLEQLLSLLANGRDHLGEPPDETSTAMPVQTVRKRPPKIGATPTVANPSGLNAELREALLAGHARDRGKLDRAVEAVRELLALDGLRAGSWRLRGLADGLAEQWRDGPAPPTPDTAFHRLVGVIEAFVHTGRHSDLIELITAHPSEIERLVADPAELWSLQPVLVAALEGAPTLARRLFLMVPEPFPNWPQVVESLRVRCVQLSSKDPVISAGLLRASDDMLTAWTPLLNSGELAAVERAAAELAVERASCQRRAGDFAGARAILGRIDPVVLSSAARTRALEEAALAACELASLNAVKFPSGSGDRESTRLRFGRAAPEIEAALSAGSDLTGRVLRAVLSVAQEEPAQVVADLRVALAALDEESDPSPDDRELHARLEFELGLGELCCLDPGTDECAARRIDAAIAAGHRPSHGALMTVATALDAHGSSMTTAAVARVLEVAPADPVGIGLLAGLAARRVEGACVLAAEKGRDERLPRRHRYELLDAALGWDGHGLDVDGLFDDLERLVAKAGDAALDHRWAARLAADDALRSALGADGVDLVRVQVLRRGGRIEDAAAVTGQLFHRALGGHVEGADPGDLLELLGQLGAEDEELRLLRRLLPARPPTAPDPTAATADARSFVVLFVGGNETQARLWPGVVRAIDERYGSRVEVEWFATGWGSNWAASAQAIESRYAEADVLVLMTFVRTMLGRRLRRTAGEAGLPWVACTGHGATSIERAIDRAVGVATSRAWEVTA